MENQLLTPALTKLNLYLVCVKTLFYLNFYTSRKDINLTLFMCFNFCLKHMSWESHKCMYQLPVDKFMKVNNKSSLSLSID